MTLAIAVNPGGATTNPQVKDRGSVIKINPKNGEYKVIAAGLRTPNGITFTKNGDLLVSDNQGDWLPASKLIHIKPQHFYGHFYSPRHPLSKQKESPPIVWMPHNEIANSPTEPLEIPQGIFQGQILCGDIHNGGIRRIFYEKVNGKYQGAVFRFSQGFLGGINRMRWGNDGNLYVGIAGNDGNWGIDAKSGLQKIQFSSKIAFEMRAIRAKSNGLEIEFTKPIAKGEGWTPEFYLVESWQYQPSENYGGPKIDFKKHKVKSISVSPNRLKVFLEIENWQAGRIFHLVVNKEMSDFTNSPLFAGEAWYTLNQIPSNQLGFINKAPESLKKLKMQELKKKISKGEEIYQTLCQSCHSINGSQLVGPTFKNLLGKKQIVIRKGKEKSVIVDKEYLKRAITNPNFEYPKGYQPIMPQTFANQLDEETMESLLNFISKYRKREE